jgi:hypothetical protein
MTEEDIDGLRAVGWTDRDILDIVQVCAYFNFRVVDGLGLQVSDQAAERAWQARQRAASLAEAKGVELPEDRWDIAGQAAKARASANQTSGGA